MTFRSTTFCALSCLILTCFYSADGYQFKVGDGSGWTLHPNEPFNHWAERNRFSVNDTLYFKYDKNIDAVLIVDKDDYNNCNTAKPQLKLEGGESVFKFDRSGPFYFITSNVTNCLNGQKLIVVVLAVRNRQTPPPSPQPVSPSPSDVPTVPVPMPSSYAPSPSPSPEVAPPGNKSAGVAVFGLATVVFSAVCTLVGLSTVITF